MLKTKIKEQILGYGIPQGTRLLCAVSGGIDSVVMLHLLNEIGYDCVVAHCNFKLRGEESDSDEKFVRDLCKNLEIPCNVITFDTHKYAEETGLSIQMAARKLRYDWFYELMIEKQCEYIALAHNSDDQVETAILNFVRGTGIRGVSGMKPVLNKLFRPLIEVSRSEIVQISEEGCIAFHNDSTNATTKYARNKVRHLVLPLLEEINIAAKENILKTVSYFSDTEKIMNDYVAKVKTMVMRRNGDEIKINVERILKAVAPQTVLFEILISEGVPKPLASEAVCLLDAQTGKMCELDDYRISRNRNHIEVIKTSSIQEQNEYHLESIGELKKYGFEISKCRYDDDFVFDKSPKVAYFDIKKLKFPITLRGWKHGDKFIPLGMKGFRKLSDFFKDEKLSSVEKSQIRIIESDGKIAWIVGMRIDERFKFDNSTTDLWIVKMQ